MDEEMKAIARRGFWSDERTGGWYGVYAACEVVLAEEKRRQAPKQMDATMADESGKYALADSTPGACNWLNINDMKNMYAVVSVQATLPHAKEIIRFAWERLTGEQPAPAALAVAREGMVPASELEASEKRGDYMSAEIEQQLATMYSLEQVEKAMRKHLHADVNTPQIDAILKSLTAKEQEPAPTKEEMFPVWESATAKAIIAERDEQWEQAVFAEIADGRLINRVRARLAKQQPTEQEKVEAILRSHGFVARTAQDFADAIAELAALGKGGK